MIGKIRKEVLVMTASRIRIEAEPPPLPSTHDETCVDLPEVHV